jgi:hypothetical protein
MGRLEYQKKIKKNKNGPIFILESVLKTNQGEKLTQKKKKYGIKREKSWRVGSKGCIV